MNWGNQLCVLFAVLSLMIAAPVYAAAATQSAAVQSRSGPRAAHPAVSVRLRTDRTHYILGEPIRVLVTIRVTGKNRVWLPFSARDIWLFFVDTPDGKQLGLRENPERDPDPEAPIPFEELEPGETRTYETNLLNEAPPLFGGPTGTHAVYLRLSAVFLDKERIDPYVDSNQIKIRISKPTEANARAYRFLMDYIEEPERSQYLLETDEKLSRHVVKEFPNTLYAGYAHLGLGDTIRRRAEELTGIGLQQVDSGLAHPIFSSRFRCSLLCWSKTSSRRSSTSGRC